MGSKIAIGSKNKGAVVIDQISCVGGEDLLGSAFRSRDSFRDAVADGTWLPEYFESPLSANATEITLKNSSRRLDYTVEQVQVWGGDSNGTCTSLIGDTETYYSFHYCLDDDTSQAKAGDIVVALEGSSDPTSPFWNTGWAGIVGNSVFDSEIIKSLRFELSLDSQGEIGSIVTGEIALRDFRVTFSQNTIDSENTVNDSVRPVIEPGLMLDSTEDWQLVEFKGGECGETCDADAECLYALSKGQDCYIGRSLDPKLTKLIDSGISSSSVNLYWMDDVSKRGNFCEMCTCNEASRTIDCTGKDLLIPPKTFTSQSWTPKILDLRENPNLVLLGTGSLTAVAETIVELRLPSNLRHMGLEKTAHLPELRVVTVEGGGERESDALGILNNVIIKPSSSYSDVCCSRGIHLELVTPPEGLTICELHGDSVGADAVYEKNIMYFDTDDVVIRSNSNFMAEATESAQKCAEYCDIHENCNFFSFDQRVGNSENVCYLMEKSGSIVSTPGQYGDEDGTIPGWISGRVARARCTIDNAIVLVSPQNMVTSEAAGLKGEYSISLGSKPMRGAVWVEPTITSSTHLQVTFTPRRVVLYDNYTTARIIFSIDKSGFNGEERIQVTHNIESCDTAFMPRIKSENQTTVNIVVSASYTSTTVIFAILIPSIVAAALCLGTFYIIHMRRVDDSAWKLKSSELRFDRPPVVLGIGSCGRVLLAEYRGTQVAVKHLAPTQSKIHNSMISTLFQEDSSEIGEIPDAPREGELSVDSGSPDQSHHGSTDSSIYKNKNPAFEHISKAQLVTFAPNRIIDAKKASVRSIFDRSRVRPNFLAEMRHLSSLRHPCITTFMGAVIGNWDHPLLVMEYMDLGALRDLLQNDTIAMDGDIILPILRDVAQGVRFLHAAEPQVVHGDLKTQNILVDSRFRAKVSDFGLATTSNSLKKRSRGLIGTPFWMAPELLRGESCSTPASDVFSFGIILYEVFSRQDPYEGENCEEIIKLVADPLVNKRPPIPPSTPPEIQLLMRACLESFPVMRPTFEQLDIRLKGMDIANLEPGETRLTSQAKKARQADSLLCDVFPRHVAEALRQGRKVDPEPRDMVTIFFSDIVGFTSISSTMPPIKVSNLLDRLYNQFDELSHKHDIFKVETIGDAYMAVTNLIKDQTDHAKRIAQFSVDALMAAKETLVDLDDPSQGVVNIRVGVHSGPVVASVVGSRNPRYCLFGDTVNTASRMESHSHADRIHCSAITAKLLRVQMPEMSLRRRQPVHVKGKGVMQTFWVNESVGSTCHKIGRRASMGSAPNTPLHFISQKALVPDTQFQGHNSYS